MSAEPSAATAVGTTRREAASNAGLQPSGCSSLFFSIAGTTGAYDHDCGVAGASDVDLSRAVYTVAIL